MNDYLMLGATLGIPALFCFAVYIALSLREVPSSKFQFGERARLGRSFPRPRGKPRTFLFRTYIHLSTRRKLDAGRIQRHPGRVCSTVQTTGRAVLWTLDWSQIACRAGAIVLLIGFWFDGGLFKLPTAATFWILLELGSIVNHKVQG